MRATGGLVAAASAALAATRPLRHRRLHPLGERSARHLTPKGALLLVQDLQGLLLRGAALAQHLVPVHRSPRATRSAGTTLALTATEAAALLAAALLATLSSTTLALTRSARTAGATHRETVGTDDIHDRLALIFGDLQGFTVARIEPSHRRIPLEGDLVQTIYLPFIQDVSQRVRRGTTRATLTRATLTRSTLTTTALALTRTTFAAPTLTAAAGATRSAGAARASRSHVVDLFDLLRRQAKFLLHRAHANHEHRAGLHAAASAGAALTAGATRSTLLRQGSRRHHSDGGESDDSVRQFHL